MTSLTLLLFGGLGNTEIILIVLVVLLLFGAKKIPELARGFGQGIREFKTAMNKAKDEVHEEINRTPEEKKSGTHNTK